MVLASSNFFRYPLIFGIKTQNGATFSLLFYPTKYLEPFFAQGNSSDITILSIFTSPVVTAFFRRMKLVSILISPNFRKFLPILYSYQEKKYSFKCARKLHITLLIFCSQWHTFYSTSASEKLSTLSLITLVTTSTSTLSNASFSFFLEHIVGMIFLFFYAFFLFFSCSDILFAFFSILFYLFSLLFGYILILISTVLSFLIFLPQAMPCINDFFVASLCFLHNTIYLFLGSFLCFFHCTFVDAS